MRRFSMFHPAVLLVYFICVLGFAMFAANPVLLGMALLGGIAFFALLTKGKRFWRGLLSSLPLFVLIAVTNPLFSHNGITPLFYLGDNPVTLESLLYGVYLALMLCAVLYWFRCFNQVLTGEKLLFLFGRAVPGLSLVLSAALRFVPLFIQKAEQIRRTRRAIRPEGGEGMRQKLRGAVSVFSCVVTWSLEHAVETGDSMRARGYASGKRSHFSLYRFTRADALLLAAVLLLGGVTLAGSITGTLTFIFYPRLTAPPATSFTLAVYGAFALLALLPFLIEWGELLRWRYYRSKI